MNKIRLTYFTPTYNRAYLLGTLYNSLVNQTDKNFIWMIVDDGSSDETRALVDKWKAENKIIIDYYYQENQGKNVAMNFAFENCKTEFICCVDSDDYLSHDATDILNKYFNKINDENIVGVVGRRAKLNGSPFSENWPLINKEIFFWQLKDEYNYDKDTMLVFKTDIVKKFKFPKFEGEKFVTESVLYNQFFYDYKLISMGELIYFSEYQEDGLTNQGLKLFNKFPKGYLYALKQNAYYSIKNKRSFKEKIGLSARYYAWKKAKHLKDCKIKEYDIKFPYNVLGFLLQWIFILKYKKELFRKN